ncbi:MAG TPA: PEPxxWA-CTERM sorting domain-containing protein, partial [Thiobacillaceae bacterium]|nr:PEPxxWA-CTERM sorting domain-containing protein [Thiobacillaceae bacterium]
MKKIPLILALLSPVGAFADSYGVSFIMYGYPDNTESYAFASPRFKLTNLSDPGVEITSFSMDDGSYTAGLWDAVGSEAASSGVVYTLTQSDRIQNQGWYTNVGYSFIGLDSGDYMQFAADPDTLHYGTGNIVDARGYLFNGGTIHVGFSNGETLDLTWQPNPAELVMNPLQRPDLPVTDDRNIYYELTQTVSAPVPEPETYALMLAGLGLVGFAARRR